MHKLRWLFMFVLLGLALSACNSAAIKDECLVGRWMVTSDDVLGKAIVPPESFSLEDMRLQRVGGAVGYHFSADGILTFQAVKWQAHFDVLAERILMPLTLYVDGIATAKVQVVDDRIAIGEVQQDGVSFIATLDGEEMMTSNRVAEFAPLFVPGGKIGQYICQGDKMSITFADASGIAYRLDFLRVKEATE